MQHKGIEDFLSINIGAVIALLIFNHIANIAAPDDGVPPRDAAVIVQHDIIGCEPANADFVFIHPVFGQLPIGPPEDEPGGPLLSPRRNECGVAVSWWLVVLRLHTFFPPQSGLFSYPVAPCHDRHQRVAPVSLCSSPSYHILQHRNIAWLTLAENAPLDCAQKRAIASRQSLWQPAIALWSGCYLFALLLLLARLLLLACKWGLAGYFA